MRKGTDWAINLLSNYFSYCQGHLELTVISELKNYLAVVRGAPEMKKFQIEELPLLFNDFMLMYLPSKLGVHKLLG